MRQRFIVRSSLFKLIFFEINLISPFKEYICSYYPFPKTFNRNNMVNTKEKLFLDFNPISDQQWLDKITEDLKGADFTKKLIWNTHEGFKVKPFYSINDIEKLETIHSLPGEYPYLRGTKKNNRWFI